MHGHLKARVFQLLFLSAAAGSMLCLTPGAGAEVVSAPERLPRNIIRIPMTRQSTDYTCGVAALQSLLAYFGDEVREDTLCKSLKSNPQEGTNYQAMVAYAKGRGYDVRVRTKMSISALKKLIDDRKPVICLIQAWAERKVDYSQDWDDGHYVVAIGYDAKNFYFMDPSTLGNYAFIPIREFEQRWHDTDSKVRLVHFGMVLEKKQPAYNHAIARKLE